MTLKASLFLPTLATTMVLLATGDEASSSSAPSEVPVWETLRERIALTVFYHATNGPNWTDNAYWLTDAPVGKWYGVVADDDGRVTGLHLGANDLSGEIPPAPVNLGRLTELRLHRNQLSGEIPAELGDLASLTELRLARNQLSGELPPELGDLASLTELRLARNQLSGEIPAELAALDNLTALRLHSNQLNGEIPPELGSLASLTSLWLNDNMLSREIPAELGNLASLTSLRLVANRLTGEIPPELGNLASLTSLQLDVNQLSGEIPPELGSLASLTSLQLDANQLSGEMPPELGSLASLTSLQLDANQLSGGMPPELGSLASLTSLRLDDNMLSGEMPPELGNLASLTELWLDANQLSGGMPPELGSLASLTSLRLNDNMLSGGIPPELGTIASLTSLRLNDNKLTGEIPPEVGDLANRIELWLRGNLLNGEIPDGPLPVRVGTPAASPPPVGEPITVALVETLNGRRFRRPTDIGTYPVGPGGGAGPGVFVAELAGRIMLLHPDGGEAVWLLDIRDRVSRLGTQEGLFSVALDPRFEDTGHLWLSYTPLGNPLRLRLSRFAADLDDLRRVEPGSELVVVEVEQPSRYHAGGALRFGPDGMLYVGLGDGQPNDDPRGEGQNLETLLGSVIRIDVAGTSEASRYAVPPDNPFVDVPGARPEIWAYGLRHPWRMAFDAATGALWAGDVGQDWVEEIDRIEAGGNYGWNRLEGTRCFNPPEGCGPEGTVLPVVEYGHHLGCAVTGGVVYWGKAVPALVGRYLFSDFCSGRLWALSPDGGDVVEVAVSPRMVSSFGTNADGEVYVLTFGGTVLSIAPPQS